jgi:hypothetical protein
MKRLIAPALIALALAGTATAETRAVSGFSGVKVEDRVTVTVAAGSGYAVEVTGSDAARIRTRVTTDGRLHIEDARRPLFGRAPLLDAHVRVTAPAFNSISASRGAELSANLTGSTCNDLDVAASMGGTATITGAQCGDVSSSASMGGELRIAGACRQHDVSASMGGFVRAEELVCETVDASASMGGDVRAFANRSYDASASMGGAVNVSGAASARDTAAVMGGSISNR